MLLKISKELLLKFKCFCSSPELIMMFVYMKYGFSLSYRDLEEMMQMRDAVIDHSTLQRWVRRFTRLIRDRVRTRKKPLHLVLHQGEALSSWLFRIAHCYHMDLLDLLTYDLDHH